MIAGGKRNGGGIQQTGMFKAEPAGRWLRPGDAGSLHCAGRGVPDGRAAAASGHAEAGAFKDRARESEMHRLSGLSGLPDRAGKYDLK